MDDVRAGPAVYVRGSSSAAREKLPTGTPAVGFWETVDHGNPA